MHDLTNPKTYHFNLSEIKSHRRILRKGIEDHPGCPMRTALGGNKGRSRKTICKATTVIQVG